MPIRSSAIQIITNNKVENFPKVSPLNSSGADSSRISTFSSSLEEEEQKLVQSAFSAVCDDYEENKEADQKKELGMEILKPSLNSNNRYNNSSKAALSTTTQDDMSQFSFFQMKEGQKFHHLLMKLNVETKEMKYI